MAVTAADVEDLVADIQRDLTIAKAKLVTLSEWAVQLPHAQPRPHTCRRCTRTFTTLEEHDEHEQSEHAEVREPPHGPRELPAQVVGYLARLKGAEPHAEADPEPVIDDPEPTLT